MQSCDRALLLLVSFFDILFLNFVRCSCRVVDRKVPNDLHDTLSEAICGVLREYDVPKYPTKRKGSPKLNEQANNRVAKLLRERTKLDNVINIPRTNTENKARLTERIMAINNEIEEVHRLERETSRPSTNMRTASGNPRLTSAHFSPGRHYTPARNRWRRYSVGNTSLCSQRPPRHYQAYAKPRAIPYWT